MSEESATLQADIQAGELDLTTAGHEMSKEVNWEQRALHAEERCRKLTEELANRTEEVSDKAKALVHALTRIGSLKEDLRKAQQAAARPGSSGTTTPTGSDVIELSKANMELARELRAKKETAAKSNRKLADTKEELTQVKRKLIETESNLDMALRELERKKNVTAKKSDSYVLPPKRNVCAEKECGQAVTNKHKEHEEAGASRTHVSSEDKDARILGLKNTWKKASEKPTPQQQAIAAFKAQASQQKEKLQSTTLAYRRHTGDLHKQLFLPCKEIASNEVVSTVTTMGASASSTCQVPGNDQTTHPFPAQASGASVPSAQTAPVLGHHRLAMDEQQHVQTAAAAGVATSPSTLLGSAATEVKWEPLSPFAEASPDPEPLNSRKGGAPQVLFNFLTMDASDRAPASTQPSLPAESPQIPCSTTPDTRVPYKNASNSANLNLAADDDPLGPEGPPREVGGAAPSKPNDFMQAPPAVWGENHPATWPLLSAHQLQLAYHTAFAAFQQHSAPAFSGVLDTRPCFSAAHPAMFRGPQMATTLFQSLEEQKECMRDFVAVNTARGISRQGMRRELTDTFRAQPWVVECFDEVYEEAQPSPSDAT